MISNLILVTGNLNMILAIDILEAMQIKGTFNFLQVSFESCILWDFLVYFGIFSTYISL